MNESNSLIRAAQEMRQAREIKLQEERDARARELSQQAASKLLDQQRKELFDNERLHIARDFLELIQGSHIQLVLFKREGRAERQRYRELMSPIVTANQQEPQDYKIRWLPSPFERKEKRIRKLVWDETPEREGYKIFDEDIVVPSSANSYESKSPETYPSSDQVASKYLYVCTTGEIIESSYTAGYDTVMNHQLKGILADFAMKNALIH